MIYSIIAVRLRQPSGSPKSKEPLHYGVAFGFYGVVTCLGNSRKCTCGDIESFGNVLDVLVANYFKQHLQIINYL